MSDYKFHPLRDFPRRGVLVKYLDKKIRFAIFLTPQEAKEIALGNSEDYQR